MSIKESSALVKSFYDEESNVMVCVYTVPNTNFFRLTSHYKDYLPKIFDLNSLSYCSTIQFCQLTKETLEDLKSLLVSIKKDDEYVNTKDTYIEFHNNNIEDDEDKCEFEVTIGHKEYYEQNLEPKDGGDIQDTYSFDIPTLKMLKKIVKFLDLQMP